MTELSKKKGSLLRTTDLYLAHPPEVCWIARENTAKTSNREGDFIVGLLVPITPFSLLEEMDKKEARGGDLEQASSEYVSKTGCRPLLGHRHSGSCVSHPGLISLKSGRLKGLAVGL